ncbi:hypothetical protein Asulf_02206 [Archaeoglobus sulfaticallidus PM70-1]|uniref:Uncharacterized protein n=1 Tax=Archaeoglobus sulfaticallidus PM70-1 TaxID=387631 RepID=N0BEU1_9EURY|nr:hypothetical protein [Archaeoglobus sulfaticallidus]AGK62159.1 hypothetical protein Asulf_02206 [Archaeoglobus sulfaticallidus PM70-1]
MYGYTSRWDEETVIKWLAVGMVLAMIGMAVIPAVTVEPSKIGGGLLLAWNAGNDLLDDGQYSWQTYVNMALLAGGVVAFALAPPAGIAYWITAGTL